MTVASIRASAQSLTRFSSEARRISNVCGEILAQARRLVASGNCGTPLNHLLSRATELFDELDEILVVLDPQHDVNDFALAAVLHRELEQLLSLAPPRLPAHSAKRQFITRR
jgi:hypothetical protein